MKPLNVGTRQSRLAQWQTDHIIARLQAAWPGLTCHKVTFVTEGDRKLDQPLPEIGGKGLFTRELEAALHRGEIDLAVHSLKDLPVENPAGLTLGAIVGRADVRDVLVARNGYTLRTLPSRATVGTSSLRRQAQLLARRPDLNVIPIRGNVETRIRKVLETPEYDAVVLAAAGVTRLGMEAAVTEWLPLETMLPAPGQGALAVQCREEDGPTQRLLMAIDCSGVRACVVAERAFLQALGGGCSLPVAAWGQATNGQVELQASVLAGDGSRQIALTGRGHEPQALGRRLAEDALAQGAGRLLAPSPLAGRRVLITRSQAQAEDFAARLRAHGARPILFPVIAFQALPAAPLNEALADISGYDWLVFTSVNAVEFFLAAYEGTRLPPVAALGAATLAQLERYRVPVDFVPATYTGVDLAQGLGDLAGQRVLLPRASAGRPDIVEQLQRQGATVTDIPLYDTIPAAPTAAALAELARGVDVITFTSPSSVRHFLAIVQREGLNHPLAESVVACIGPSTAAEARARGLSVTVVPETYTIEALIEAMEAYYQVTHD